MKALFLDRDGTLNADTGYVYRLSDFLLLPGVIKGLSLLREAGFSFFIVTNQSGIARGLYTEQDYERFNGHLTNELKASGINIEKSYFCPFLPDAAIEQYRKDSPLRKPSPGMLELAAKEYPVEKELSFMIGDKETDIEAGKRFGIRSILLRTKDAQPLVSNADFIAEDIISAAQYILTQ
jgi:D-glycero-D-manno-heptose 1,7-bisphosphate phosphatase